MLASTSDAINSLQVHHGSPDPTTDRPGRRSADRVCGTARPLGRRRQEPSRRACQPCLPAVREALGVSPARPGSVTASDGAVGAEGEDAMTTERVKSGQSVVDAGSLFQTVNPGHDERQVEGRIAELQARVSALEAELEDARGELLAAGDDPVATPAQGSPGNERISRRML